MLRDKELMTKTEKKSIMGKAEIDKQIKLLEEYMKKYVFLSELSDRNEELYKQTLERIRMQLAVLYAERENFKH